MVKRRVREDPEGASVPKFHRRTEAMAVPFEGWRDPGQRQAGLSH